MEYIIVITISTETTQTQIPKRLKDFSKLWHLNDIYNMKMHTISVKRAGKVRVAGINYCS